MIFKLNDKNFHIQTEGRRTAAVKQFHPKILLWFNLEGEKKQKTKSSKWCTLTQQSWHVLENSEQLGGDGWAVL